MIALEAWIRGDIALSGLPEGYNKNFNLLSLQYMLLPPRFASLQYGDIRRPYYLPTPKEQVKFPIDHNSSSRVQKLHSPPRDDADWPFCPH